MATYDVTVILGPGSLKRFGSISPIVDLRSIIGLLEADTARRPADEHQQ
jgi:hypothetical protein